MLPAGYTTRAFVNGYDGSTNIGTNGLSFKVGDRITLSGFFKWPNSSPLENGNYIITGIGNAQGLRAFNVSGTNTSTWHLGSATQAFAGARRITSSSGAEFYLPTGSNKMYPGLTITLYGGPNAKIGVYQDNGPTIVLDDPVTPDNPPTTPTVPPNTPTTPTTPITPPPIVVKRNGTTVTVPFLSSASFKPGTNARANERGKVAFIKAVQAASKASNLNKAQSDQLMADVVKAIKEADLKRRKITPLKGKK